MEEKQEVRGDHKKLKPVIFEGSEDSKHKPRELKQRLLLNAMETTQDPEKLRKMIGARNIAEVERVFDTMANQKEFQKSLKKSGITFDFMTTRLKSVMETASKDSDVLKAIQIVMQAAGVDKFVQDPAGTANWQDLLVNTMAKKGEYLDGEIVEVGEAEETEDDMEMYEVNVPQIPESLRKRDAEEGGHSSRDEVEIDEALKKIYE